MTKAARRLVVLATAFAVTVTGCAAGGDAEPTTTASPSSTPTGTTTPEPSPVELPSHAAGEAAAWVLEQVNASVGTPVEGVEDRFAPSFLDQVPADQLPTVLDQLRPAAPWQPTSVEGSEQALVIRLSGAGAELDLQLALDDDGLISTLLFTPPPPPREPATSFAELTEEVASLDGATSLLVARVQDGRCVPVDGMPAGSAAGEQLPIGSVVKLYVLGAVADAVAGGDLTWDTVLTVTDALRSLPSGQLQDEPAGTELTVREAARLMISISDNTATDLLIDAVGRAQVEQAMVDMDHSDPGVNMPLATTRELFHLGWGGGEELREQWRDADESGRRAILAELPDGPPEVDPAEMSGTAVWTHGVDWFATADDLCAAHVALAELGGTAHGEPVPEILALNPGLEVDAEQWPYVGFKGGSSVGTMAGSWYAQDADGAATVVVLQTAARVPGQALHGSTMSEIAADALRLAR